MDKTIRIQGVSQGWGAQNRETERAAEKLRRAGIASWVGGNGFDVQLNAEIKPDFPCSDRPDILPKDAGSLVYDVNHRLMIATQQTLSDNAFPLTIGGDHSIAIGTWSGVTSALTCEGRFGLIWLDAHMDAHTPETTPSNAIHGMPLAVLLGEGDASLCNMGRRGKKISPEHLVLIGVRSYESGEAERLERLGVRVIKQAEVKTRGFADCFSEAVRIATQGTRGFGLSVDIDGFDPQHAPGVGTPEADGLRPEEVIPALRGIGHHPNIRAIEIAEFNPERDHDDKTLKVVRDLIQSLFAAPQN